MRPCRRPRSEQEISALFSPYKLRSANNSPTDRLHVVNPMSLPYLVVGMHPFAGPIVTGFLQKALAIDATQQPHPALVDFIGHEEELIDGLVSMVGGDLGGVVLAGRNMALHRFDPDAEVQGRHEVRLTGCIAKNPL